MGSGASTPVSGSSPLGENENKNYTDEKKSPTSPLEKAVESVRSNVSTTPSPATTSGFLSARNPSPVPIISSYKATKVAASSGITSQNNIDIEVDNYDPLDDLQVVSKMPNENDKIDHLKRIFNEMKDKKDPAFRGNSDDRLPDCPNEAIVLCNFIIGCLKCEKSITERSVELIKSLPDTYKRKEEIFAQLDNFSSSSFDKKISSKDQSEILIELIKKPSEL